MSSGGRELAFDVRAARSLAVRAEAIHAETVMDLSVAGELAATIDFAGNWAVWRCRDLGRVAGGTIPRRVGRRVALSPDGAKLAVLTGAEGIDHQWTAAFLEIASGVVVPFGNHDFRQIQWTDAGLFATSYRRYRVYHPTGELIRRGVESDRAWDGSAATRDGSRVYFVLDQQLAAVSVADGAVVPAPDLAPFRRPPGESTAADLAVSDDGGMLALAFLDEVLVWRLADGELLARLIPTGVQLVGARVRFAGERLIATFREVRRDAGQRKLVATVDVAGRRLVDLVVTGRHAHGEKGGAAGDGLVAHGASLTLAAERA